MFWAVGEKNGRENLRFLLECQLAGCPVYMINSIGAGFLSRLFSSQSYFFFPFWKLFNYLWLAGKKVTKESRLRL